MKLLISFVVLFLGLTPEPSPQPQTIQALRAEIKTLQSTLVQQTQIIKQLRKKLIKQTTEIKRLESLCRKHGINPAKQIPTKPYKIIDKDDVSYGGVVRLVFRIRVRRLMTESELRNICEKIIRQQKKIKPCNAIGFFFYLPGSDSDGPYTAGKADWAPNGLWEQAGNVATGNYSKHKLVVKTGGVLGIK